MKCPFCTSDLNKVVDKRTAQSRGEIRRRRECLKCSKRFTTYETLARVDILVVKKDGRRQSYDQDKLKAGILKALEKRPGIDRSNEIVNKMVGLKFRISASTLIRFWELFEKIKK